MHNICYLMPDIFLHFLFQCVKLTFEQCQNVDGIINCQFSNKESSRTPVGLFTFSTTILSYFTI